MRIGQSIYLSWSIMRLISLRKVTNQISINIVFGIALVMVFASVVIVIRLKHLASKMVPLTSADIT